MSRVPKKVPKFRASNSYGYFDGPGKALELFVVLSWLDNDKDIGAAVVLWGLRRYIM